MHLSRRMFLRVGATVVALTTMHRFASAQDYPTRPITLVVPFPAGGPADLIARILGERMRASLGQPIVVENVSGAGGSIGVARVARAAPDGYTLSIGQLNSHVFSGAAYSVRYDLLKDFSPIALLTTNPQMLVGRKNLPAKDMRELIAWLRANPDSATYATPGVGSPSHVWGIHLQNQAGARVRFVPYRGAAPALQDVLSGQVDLTCLQASDLLPQVRGGNVKGYAILAKETWAPAAEIPTVDEAGIPGLHMPFWHGLWAPANTPGAVIAKLNAAVVEALDDAKVRQRITDMGQDTFPIGRRAPEALAALQREEIKKWWPVIKAANIRLE